MGRSMGNGCGECQSGQGAPPVGWILLDARQVVYTHRMAQP